jgi:hypothetical protein
MWKVSRKKAENYNVMVAAIRLHEWLSLSEVKGFTEGIAVEMRRARV